MNRPIQDLSKTQLMDEITQALHEGQEAVSSFGKIGQQTLGDLSDDTLQQVRQNLDAIKLKLDRLQHAAVDQTREAAHATNAYVHHHPWQMIGVAAGVSAVVGVLMSQLITRR